MFRTKLFRALRGGEWKYTACVVSGSCRFAWQRPAEATSLIVKRGAENVYVLMSETWRWSIT